MACPNEQPDREIDMTEFPTARAAIAHARTTGGRALSLGGRSVVVSAADAEWLEGFGSAFAYLHELHGRIVTVPVNQ
jgi:hypothetical protein